MAEFEFTAKELTNLLAASIDFHDKGEVAKQSLEDKHLLRMLEAGSTGFPGHLEYLTWRAKFDYDGEEEGFSGDEVVSYYNPANLRQCQAKWYERHIGISCTFTELKKGGISVVDTTSGIRTKDHANAGAARLANIWKDKIEDMAESRRRSRSRMFWLDGSQSARDVPGVTYWVVDDPTVPLVVAGIDQSANEHWRNRSLVGANAIVANASNASSNVLVSTLQTEYRQLTRYGGRPNTCLCGSDFLDQIEAELRARGSYTETGWSKSGSIDVSMAEVAFRGMKFVYEPELDALGHAKRMYWLEIGQGGLRLMHMDSERDKDHTPARPEDRYTLYYAKTWTGGLVCRRRNGMGVYAIA